MRHRIANNSAVLVVSYPAACNPSASKHASQAGAAARSLRTGATKFWVPGAYTFFVLFVIQADANPIVQEPLKTGFPRGRSQHCSSSAPASRNTRPCAMI